MRRTHPAADGIRHDILSLPTSDGTMRTHLLSRAGEARAGLIVYMDVFGIREELLGLCAAYVGRGFAVYLPNLFYREGDLSFPPPCSPDDTTPPDALRLNTATSIDMSARDLPAILAHCRDAMPEIRHFGAIGYCMGGRHALKALATRPETVKAAACIHGGRLVIDGPDSPHLLIAGLKGPAYFAFATNDHACPDAHQAVIESEVARAPVAHIVRHFNARHGWSFPTRYCHDEAAAAQVFRGTTDLFQDHCGGSDG